MLILLGVNVFPSAIKDILASFRPRTTGDMLILPDSPGPKVDPPLRIRAEYSQGEQDLSALKKELEEVLRNKLVFRADIELVPEGTLPRFEMKAKLIKTLHEEKSSVSEIRFIDTSLRKCYQASASASREDLRPSFLTMRCLDPFNRI